MSLTVLPDVILSNGVIHAGVRGRNKRSNTRAMDGGGFTKINVNWARTLREYELGIVPMLPAQWQEIEALFEATEGGAYGLLMRDPKDATVKAGEGLLQPWSAGAAVGALGFGFGVPTYRLTKRYTYGARNTDRLITRPIANPAVLRSAVAVTAGAGAEQIAHDLTTGTVTFVADVSQAVASITVGASTVLTFANGTGAVAALAVGQRVFVTGVTGTAAALLNGLSHTITARNTTTFTLTISVNTTGLTATAGTAAKYPQATETLTWTGGFYVPVHFASDDLDWDILRSGPADTRIIAGPSVTLMEVREP